MNRITFKISVLFASLATMLISPAFVRSDTAPSDTDNDVPPQIEFKPVVMKQFIEEARKNKNWKSAVATGKNGQVVFMSICPHTNSSNEIGTEVHPFDQVILIVEGNGKAVMNGSTALVKSGDMVFIPQGKSHNVINLEEHKPLKLISFYSNTDIPKDAVYKTKADQP